MVGDVAMLRWRRTDGRQGYSVARVECGADGWRCCATEVVADPRETLACHFVVELDQEWVTREVEVSALSAVGERRVALQADRQRSWLQDGRRAHGLDGCVDVDVAATPLTNTFPIRRFAALDVGESRTVPVAWVEVPSLRVLRVAQTYRRLGSHQWQYSDPAHGAFELSVDDDGFVVDYRSFAERLA